MIVVEEGGDVVTFAATSEYSSRGCYTGVAEFSAHADRGARGRGSALFGVGWGIVGFCPGPAIAVLGTGLLPVFAFVAAMLADMAIHPRLRGS